MFFMTNIDCTIDFEETESATQPRAILTLPPQSPPMPPIATATGHFDGDDQPVGGDLLDRLAKLRNIPDRDVHDLLGSAKIAKVMMNDETEAIAKRDVHLLFFKLIRTKLEGTLLLHKDAMAMHLDLTKQCDEVLRLMRVVMQKLNAVDPDFIPFNAKDYLADATILDSTEGLRAYYEQVDAKRSKDWHKQGSYINKAGYHMTRIYPRERA